MLEFKEVFTYGHVMSEYSITLMMKCKNIDFSHTSWEMSIFDYTTVVYYIIDNITDIDVIEYQEPHCHSYTLLQNIICRIEVVGINENYNKMLNYLLNNGYIGNNTFTFLNQRRYRRIVTPLIKYIHLVKYLTNTSLGRFTRFYNIQKYYDIITTMLLIIKVYQKLSCTGVALTSLPPVIVKHLILPFIYQ